MRVVVTATNPDGAILEASQPTTLVQDAGPYNQSPPVITGTARRGSAAHRVVRLVARPGQHVRLPVAVLARRHRRGRDRRRDGVELHAGGGRRGPAPARRRDRGQRRRHRDGGQRRHRRRPGHAAGGQRQAGDLRRRRARHDAHLDARHVGRRRQRRTRYQWQRDSGSGYTDIADATTADLHAGRGRRGREGPPARHRRRTRTPPSRRPATRPPWWRAPRRSTPRCPRSPGRPSAGPILSATQGAWNGVGNTYAYQWQASPDGTRGRTSPAPPRSTTRSAPATRASSCACSSPRRTPTRRVSAASAPTAMVPSAPPVNTAAPAVTGTAQRALDVDRDHGRLERHRQRLRLPVAARQRAAASPTSPARPPPATR